MRPHLNLRARHAATALGALCLAISLAVLPGTARSDDTTAGHAADRGRHRPRQEPTQRARRTAGLRARARALGRGRPARAAAAPLRPRAGRRSTGPPRAPAAPSASPSARSQSGSARLRVLVDAARREIGRLNVYRHAAVSWYGPGLYGNKLSCGGRLTPGTLGVAHKTLPCGARVTLRRGDRVIRVRVVDRGPYVGGREFDLTSATRAKLHFGGVGSLLVAS